MQRLGIAIVCLALVAGCGEDDEAEPIRVGAASSLRDALRDCSSGIRISFAGSDELGAQVRQGAELDVLAAANTAIPEELRGAGLVEEPVVFATNELVLAAPADGEVRSIDDLADPSRTLVIGAPGVPVGKYTRTVLDRLGDRVRAEVRSEEPDVAGIVGKLVQGAADAGFVYRTDVRGTGDALRAITLPADAQPVVRYGAAVVAESGAKEAAREYLAGLRSGPCADALRRAGFGAP